MTDPIFFHLTLTLILELVAKVALIGGSAGALVSVLTNLVKMVVILIARKRKFVVPDQLFGKIVFFVNLAVIIVLYFVLGQLPPEVLPDNVDQWIKVMTLILTLVMTLIPANGTALVTHKQMVSLAPTWFSVSGRKFANQYGALATSDAVPNEVKAEIVAQQPTGGSNPSGGATRPT